MIERSNIIVSSTRVKNIVAVVLFIAVAILANYASAYWGMVPIGLGLAVSAGTFGAGLALVLRDAIHETAGVRWVWIAVAIAAIISWPISPAVAVASTVAFVLSESTDTAVYAAARRRFTRAHAVAFSGLVGAAVDTGIFLWLAPWPFSWNGFIGQLLVKVALSVMAALYVASIARRNSARREIAVTA